MKWQQQHWNINESKMLKRPVNKKYFLYLKTDMQQHLVCFSILPCQCDRWRTVDVHCWPAWPPLQHGMDTQHWTGHHSTMPASSWGHKTKIVLVPKIRWELYIDCDLHSSLCTYILFFYYSLVPRFMGMRALSKRIHTHKSTHCQRNNNCMQSHPGIYTLTNL